MNTHRVYLLRIWTEAREELGSGSSWRATLEEPRTGKRWGFTEPAALVAFLEALINERESGGTGEGHRER